MIDAIIWIISWTFMLCGCFFIVTGAVGMIRMPDLYTRLHATSTTDTGGVMLISIALIVQALFVFDNGMAAIKVLLILFFTLFTAPTASHILAKTALLSGLIPKNKNGEPLLASSEEATQLARSRPADYQSGQDGEEFRQQLSFFNSEVVRSNHRERGEG